MFNYSAFAVSSNIEETNLTIKLIDGINNDSKMLNTRIDVREVLADGSTKWLKKITTNSDGQASIFLDGLNLAVDKGSEGQAPTSQDNIDTVKTYELSVRSRFKNKNKKLNITTTGTHVFRVGSPLLNVTLRDAKTGEAIPDTRVTAYRVEAGKKDKWLTRDNSDANGKLSLDIPAFTDGVSLRLVADKVHNKLNAYSSIITSAGDFNFSIGDLRIQVMDSHTNQPLAEQQVSIYTRSDDKNKWYGRATTDVDGLLHLNLKGLNTDNATPPNYILKTRSPFNGNYKYSQTINTLGDHKFTVGTPLLNIILSDAKTGAAIPDTRVTAYRIEAGKKDKWLTRGNSDTNGKLSLDIPAFTDGISVRLVADKVHNKLNAYSSIITSAGDFNFSLGEVRIKVLDISSNLPLAEKEVRIYTVSTDGKNKWYDRATTDADGLLSLNLKGLNADNKTPPSYILKTRSPFNGNYKYSQTINTLGDHIFNVGTPLLNITLRDAKTGTAVPNTRVTAYRIEADKKDKWLTRANSDANGKLSLDIPAFTDGVSVRLVADKVHNKLNAYSSIITSAGDFNFSIGDVRIKVLDTRNNQPLAEKEVRIYTVSTDGKNKWYGKATTDSEGLLRLNLKGLNADSKTSPNYILKTRSPFNNRYKYSQTINTLGDHEFLVGQPLLTVTLKDASNNNAPIANAEIWAYKIINGKSQGAGKATTDTQGVAEFDIPDLSQSGSTVQLRTRFFNKRFSAISQNITQAGAVDFKLATTVITLKDGAVANGQALAAGVKVNLREVISADETKSVANIVTDSAGKIRLTLPLLGNSKSYVLRAKNPNPVMRHTKTSQIIASQGQHEFIVGTELLNVTLVDGLTQSPLAERRIDVYKIRMGEKAQWLGKLTTDSQGNGLVDIPLLAEEGNSFYLRAYKPYNVSHVNSQPFNSKSYAVNFPVGKTPVTLIDKNSGSSIPNQRIDAYEKLVTGKLKWRAKGNTDATGVVHFDLSQLALGNTHVFRTQNPFGNNKRYYSVLVSAEGTVNFSIARDEDSPLDLKVPDLAITAPVEGSNIGTTGVTLTGTATDNERITAVSIELSDGNSSSTHSANYDSSTGTWELVIGTGVLIEGTTLQVTATAVDASQNQTTVSTSYLVVADASAPNLTLLAPANEDNVPSTGFLVNGTATDDTGIAKLHAQILDASGAIIIDRDIDISSSGNWAVAVNNGQLDVNTTITVTITATDIADRETIVTLTLNVIPVNNEARQMINRITFGATPTLLDEIKISGVTAFLNTQLAPDTIDDSALEAMLESNGEPFTTEELQVNQLTHMIHSRRQLREVMAWFWENHFNTDINKEDNQVGYEFAEYNAFRRNALGNFRELLDISAKSPAMLIYLDSIFNISSDANENYAREVMELSTCGVDACYDQDDIESLAEILTGWQVRNDTFYFNASEHTAGSKVFLGVTIAENGVEEGNTALDMLANHNATANYICSKLIQVFVTDTPNENLNTRCANTFQIAANDNDQMAQVVRMLLTSPEFNSASNFNGKIKTPVEYAVGVARSLNGQGDYENLPGSIRRMGMRLFENPVPTGWKEIGNPWINSALLQERTRFVNEIARASSNSHLYIDPVNFFTTRNLETAEGIVSYLLDLLGGDIWSDLERQTALEILDQGDGFDINAATANERLRELIGTALSYPEYNYQ
jgi:uncharacterized protein (DUF1800 family)/5-hydroxyisourate hydrolase-like protein (transthyretin family)